MLRYAVRGEKAKILVKEREWWGERKKGREREREWEGEIERMTERDKSLKRGNNWSLINYIL